MELSTSNKSIAKNVTFLYFRMFVIMLISLYSSRVVLQSLGVIDYGIYNVVWGVITMMNFVNAALSASTSRNLTYALGLKDNEILSKTFSASLCLHLMVVIFVIVVGETIGLWFVSHKLVIPENRLNSALVIYQFTIITTCVQFTQVPYTSSLISHEDMSIYAYVGLAEAFVKLIIVWIISIIDTDKLVLFGALSMLSTVCFLLFYRRYTQKKYSECRFKLVVDKKMYKELVGYSGWNLLGGISTISQGQVITIFINLFFGPILNTARAIALQVQSAVNQMLTNFLLAVKPQIIKNSAQKDYDKMYDLSFRAGKYSFFLMMFICLPIIFEAEYVLQLWLGTVPPYSRIFTILTLSITLIQVFQEVVFMPFHAIGKMKAGNVVYSLLMLTSVIVMYIMFKNGAEPEWALYVSFAFICLNHIAYVILIHKYRRFSYGLLVKTMYLPSLVVFAFSMIAPVVITQIMNLGFCRFLINIVVTEIVSILVIYFVGLKKSERLFVKTWISNKIFKKS